MGWLLIIFFLIIGLGVLSIRSREELATGFGITLVAVALVGIVVCTFAVTETTNDIFSAARVQGIAVTTSLWRQQPSATDPCKVELRYNKHQGRLLLTGANIVASPEVLAAICAAQK